MTLAKFPERAAAEVLRAIDLPVHAAMKLNGLRDLLGDPVSEHRFVKDRVSYDFIVPGPPKYDISCTVLNEGGLTYLVVMAPLPRGRG